MIVTVEPVLLKLPAPRGYRTPGVHLSGIIRCIATETGLLKQDWVEELALVDRINEITDPVAILRICIGLAWEEWYIPQIPDVVDHPGEMQIENIYMTPDGESMSVIITPVKKLRHFIHEVKATYKSTKTVGMLEDQWMWVCQLQAYCFARTTRFAKLHVLFICGDYKFPIRPMLWVYTIEFAQSELIENFELLKDYVMEKLGGIDVTSLT